MAIARFAANAMATRFELLLEGEAESRLRGIAEEVFDEIRWCESSWSLFDKQSVIARCNREAAEKAVRLDSETWWLLGEALRIAEATEGAFDPTLGGLMLRYGFRGEPCAVEEAHGFTQLEFDEGRRSVRFLQAGLQLDLGAIAKGRALDLAGEILREQGIERALIHGGTSSVLAIGAPLGLDGWKIALGESPTSPSVCLRDQALSLSSSAGRRSAAGGHLMDGRRGKPSRAELSCAVVGPTACAVDAWSTALCVAGEALELPSSLQAMLRDHGADEAWRDCGTPTHSFRQPEAPASDPVLRA